MTRDILENSCKHKTCEELAEMCNGRGCHTLRCPAYNASCPDGLAEIDDSGQIGCDSVTPEDWQKVFGEIPEKTDTHEEILEPSNNINEGSRKVMTRDNLDNDCHDKTCEELAEMCDSNLCPTALFAWESAVFGRVPFIRAWGALRSCVSSLRRGERIPEDLRRLSTALSAAPSVYARLGLSAKYLSLQVPDLSARPAELAIETPRELRERFRPHLTGNVLRDPELRAARDLLSKIDRAGMDDPGYFNLLLEANRMLERFSLLRYKRGISNVSAGETVGDSALAKLKGRFGRL